MRTKFVSVMSFLVLAASASSASLLEADLHERGDSLLSYDTETGLYWLDLTETVGRSVSSIEAESAGLPAFGEFTSRLSFRYATGDQVETLFLNAGIQEIDYGGTANPSPGNVPGARLLLELLGCIRSCTDDGGILQGMTSVVLGGGARLSPLVEWSGEAASAHFNSGLSASGWFGAGSFLVRSDTASMPLADPAALGEVKLFPTVSAETDFFGDAAVMEGSTLVFGASANVSMGTLPGSAHVFELVDAAGNGWSAPTELEPYDDTDPISYGQAVALDGDVLVIGARRSSESGAGTGAAYVLARDPMGGGAWADTAKLLPSLPEVGAHFGTSVAVSGDHVAVGAPDGSRGTVFVYGFDGASWVEQAVLQRPTDIGSDLCGQAVALVDGLLVVGDPAGGDAVFVYEEDAGTWTLLDSVAPSPNRAGGGFGFAIDLDPSGTFVVGAPVGDGVDVEVGVAFVSTKRPQGETGRKSRSCWMPEVCGPTASAAQWRSMVTGSESVRRGESTRCPIRDRSSSIDGSPGRAANG